MLVAVLALTVVSLILWTRVKSLERFNEGGTGEVTKALYTMYARPAFDAGSKKLYFPEVNVSLPYDSTVASKFIYMTSSTSRTLYIGSPDTASGMNCYSTLPITIAIGQDSAAYETKHYEKQFEKVLSDGSTAVVYTARGNCLTMMHSDNFKPVLDVLRNIDSF